jgi:PIN domain nuclease of toxin-antitoxin system
MILLDTNVLLWLFIGDERLSTELKNNIEQDPSAYYVSIVTLWEIAIKQSIGKLKVAIDIPKAIQKDGFHILSLTIEHIYAYEILPLIHRDPFDRMLVAQALSESIVIATSDSLLIDYGIKIINARS